MTSYYSSIKHLIKLNHLFILSICLVLKSQICFSQEIFSTDSDENIINFMDGKVVEYDSIIIDTANQYIQYSFYNQRNIKKNKLVFFYDVFSYRQDGIEEIIYKTYDYDEFSVDDMRIVISGKRDAMFYHKSLPVFIEGTAFGMFSTLLPYSSFFSLSIPLLYCTSKGFSTPPESLIKKQNPNYTENELYIYGYRQRAKNKDLLSAIGGSLLGAGIGTAIVFIIRSITE